MLLLDVSDPGQLAGLIIPAVVVGCWVLDWVNPPAEARRRKRERKARKLVAEVRTLWETREGAVDWLILQGMTRKAAERAYEQGFRIGTTMRA